MPELLAVPKIPMQLTRGCLLATVQPDLDDAIIAQFQRDLLERVRDTGARAVLLDLSAVGILDDYEFGRLRDVLAMARVMGARGVLVGLTPGLASALVELDVDTGGLESTLTAEDAFVLLEPAAAVAEEADPDERVSDADNPPVEPGDGSVTAGPS